jgi:hypothetical protein
MTTGTAWMERAVATLAHDWLLQLLLLDNVNHKQVQQEAPLPVHLGLDNQLMLSSLLRSDARPAVNTFPNDSRVRSPAKRLESIRQRRPRPRLCPIESGPTSIAAAAFGQLRTRRTGTHHTLCMTPSDPISNQSCYFGCTLAAPDAGQASCHRQTVRIPRAGADVCSLTDWHEHA